MVDKPQRLYHIQRQMCCALVGIKRALARGRTSMKAFGMCIATGSRRCAARGGNNVCSAAPSRGDNLLN
jgi:hypothetical protein